jgi:hypothetical protein
VKHGDKNKMLRDKHFDLVVELDFTNSELPEVLRQNGLLNEQNYEKLEVNILYSAVTT